MSRARTVVVGSAIIDVALYSDHFPQPGDSLVCSGMITSVGGKGSNQAIAVSRLGGEAWLIAKIGPDNWGREALELWRTESIKTDFVSFHKTENTGMGISFTTDGGENWTASSLNANKYLTVSDVRAARNVIASSAVLSIHFNAPIKTILYALKVAKRYGAVTILNASPPQRLTGEILSLADIVIINEREAFKVCGQSVFDDRSAFLAARKLTSMGAAIAIISLGKRGLILCNGDKKTKYGAFSVDAVDTVGAGDALTAGMAVAICEGKSLQQTVRFALAVSALCVTNKGSWQSMPRRNDVDRFLQRQIRSK